MSIIGEDKKNTQGKVYFTRAEGTDDVKVGRAGDPKSRRSQLQTANSNNLVVEFCHSTHQPAKLETQIHDDLAHCNIRGEWYVLPSNTDYQKIIENAEQKLNMLNESAEEVSRLKTSLACAKARLQDLQPKKRKKDKVVLTTPDVNATPQYDLSIPMVSFEDPVTDQIKTYLSQIEILYKVFDNVSIDPDTLTLSLNEAVFHALLAEPNMDSREARDLSQLMVSVISNRRRRGRLAAGKGPSGKKRHKHEGTYLDYHSLCIELLRQKRLSVVPHALVCMSANVLATSPTFILALNCRLRKISNGRPNAILIRCVLGLGDDTELQAYMSQVREYNLRTMPCMQLVRVKGQHTMRTCGNHIIFGKEKCSYHMRRE